MRFLIASASLLFFVFCVPVWAMSSGAEKIILQTKSGEELIYQVELASTPEEQRKGLMFRNSLPENAGMLFIFHHTAIQTFWMKNTLIPLDLIFVDEFGVIKHIHHAAIPHDETPISSQFPAKAVLEINGGQAEARGIKIGDRILYKVFLADSDIVVY